MRTKETQQHNAMEFYTRLLLVFGPDAKSFRESSQSLEDLLGYNKSTLPIYLKILIEDGLLEVDPSDQRKTKEYFFVMNK